LAWCKTDLFMYTVKSLLAWCKADLFLYTVKSLLAWCMSNPDPSTWIAFLICSICMVSFPDFNDFDCDAIVPIGYFVSKFSMISQMWWGTAEKHCRKEFFQDFFKKDFTICHKIIIGGA
jgi:hypothetical protein